MQLIQQISLLSLLLGILHLFVKMQQEPLKLQQTAHLGLTSKIQLAHQKIVTIEILTGQQI